MKDKSKARDTRINLRVTAIQLQIIKEKAKQENKTMTQLMIDKTLNEKK